MPRVMPVTSAAPAISVAAAALLLQPHFALAQSGPAEQPAPSAATPTGSEGARTSSASLDNATVQAEEEGRVRFTLTPGFTFQFDTGLDEGNGDFNVWRAGADYRVLFPLNDSARLTVGADYEYSHYDFDAPNVFLPAPAGDEPFDGIHIIDLSLSTNVRASEEWSWFAGVRGRFAGESDVDVDDAAMGGVFGGVSRAFGEGRSIGLGALVATQIEDDPLVIPLVNVTWAFNDAWRLETQGTRGEIVHTFDERNEFALGAAWENRRFRLSDDPLTRAAVVEDTSVPVYLRWSHELSDAAELSLLAGVIAHQEFEVSDRHGDNERDFDADTAGFLGAAVKFSF